jgi:peptide/nickel transport system substrate-binding protein
VRFDLKAAYNHDWFLYNELSQVTPLPAAWDRTASGHSNCAGDTPRTAPQSATT